MPSRSKKIVKSNNHSYWKVQNSPEVSSKKLRIIRNWGKICKDSDLNYVEINKDDEKKVGTGKYSMKD